MYTHTLLWIYISITTEYPETQAYPAQNAFVLKKSK